MILERLLTINPKSKLDWFVLLQHIHINHIDILSLNDMFLHVVSNWYMLDFGIHNHCNSRFSFHYQLISLHTFLIALSWNVLINVGWEIVLLLFNLHFSQENFESIDLSLCCLLMCLLNYSNRKVLKSHFLQGWGRINKASKHTSFKISKKLDIFCVSQYFQK